MSELTLTVMRLGFLAVLWLFVIVAVQVIRSDLFGTRVTQRGSARRGAPDRPQAQ
ncbi:FHA domain-containing protein, partial [Streptomyces sp. SID8382]|nr:FHA domain-containing protein [Streptomyces sp. SID8382]